MRVKYCWFQFLIPSQDLIILLESNVFSTSQLLAKLLGNHMHFNLHRFILFYIITLTTSLIASLILHNNIPILLDCSLVIYLNSQLVNTNDHFISLCKLAFQGFMHMSCYNEHPRSLFFYPTIVLFPSFTQFYPYPTSGGPPVMSKSSWLPASKQFYLYPISSEQNVFPSNIKASTISDEQSKLILSFSQFYSYATNSEQIIFLSNIKTSPVSDEQIRSS